FTHILYMIIQAALLIPLTMTLTVHLLFLLFSSGAGAQNGWGVTYNPTSICAVKGSTVNMSCTYTYPSDHSVMKAYWSKELPVQTGVDPPELLNYTDYRGRVQYLGDKHHNDTLRLQNVTEKDQIKYYFRFITDKPGGKYTGAGGVDLKVTGLQVEVPERVMEGGNITLTCNTTCSLTVTPTFTWYRGGGRLSSSTDQLHLQPVSREDAGRYHCSVMDQNSPEVTLNVRYGPKSVSVSISPPGYVVEGSSVNLTCSSDANPPVQNYTWYKVGGDSPVGSGHRYSALQNGSYYCVAQNEYGSQKSAAVTVKDGPKNISASISPSGEIVEGSSVTLTCSSDADPPVNCTWFKGTSSVVKGKTYTLKVSSVDSGGYRCRCSNGYIEKYSAAVSLNVLCPPRNISLSVSASDEILGGSSFTLTCHSDANPPVQNYTWFKDGGDSPVGSGHSYSPLQSGSYYCEAQNEYGSQKSAGVTVSVKGLQSVVLIAVLGVVVGCLLVVIAVLCLRYVCDRKMLHTMNINTDDTWLPSLNGVSSSRPIWAEENIYSNMTVTATTSDTSPLDPDPSHQDDVQYASVVPRTANNPWNARRSAVTASACGTDGEVRSACIQHRHDDMVEMSEGGGAQYASVRFTSADSLYRPAVSTLDDDSVIYSNMT
ncbi:hypothetical protein NFI96_030400, partial [Prochilodus magdalenae]